MFLISCLAITKLMLPYYFNKFKLVKTTSYTSFDRELDKGIQDIKSKIDEIVRK